MTDIAELVVRIKADASQLQQEMAKASGVVKEQATGMEKVVGSLKDQFKELIPAITIAAMVEFARQTIEVVSHINDLALRTGFAATSLSALEPALKTSGSSLDDFAGSINRMNNLIGEAAKGTNQEAVKAFDALGLSVRKLQQLSPEEQFYQIAEALGGIDDQSKMTNAGMAIFGRSFASIIPLIKEANGNIEEHVAQLKATKEALSQDTIDRIDAFGDAMDKMWIRLRNNAATALAEVLKFADTLEAKSGIDFSNPEFGSPMPKRDSTTRPQTVDQITFENQSEYGDSEQSLYDYQIEARKKSAKGSNAGLLTPPKDSALKEYIANLKQETEAVGQNERALFIARAEIEATAKAKADFNDKLRSSKELLPTEKASVDSLAGSYYDLKKAQEENARVAKMMQDALSDSLADIALDFKNLQSTATSAIQAIAKEIIKAKITGPISKGIIDSFSGGSTSSSLLSGLSSIGSMFTGLGFADGGSPPVGRASIVGENGPEMFVPSQAGTIIPNGKMGGNTVVVNQTFALNPGATEQTVAQLRNLVPSISDATYNRVFQALRNGGSESQIAGLRS